MQATFNWITRVDCMFVCVVCVCVCVCEKLFCYWNCFREKFCVCIYFCFF